MVAEEPEPQPSARTRRKVRTWLLLVVLVVAYGSAVVLSVYMVGGRGALFLVAPLLLPLLAFGINDAVKHDGRGLRAAWLAFVLAVMVALGLIVNEVALKEQCIETGCGSDAPYRVLAVPDVYGLLALHAVAVTAFVVSRRRPHALRARSEACLTGALAVGLVLHAALGLQFADLLGQIIFLPLTFPVLTPYLTLIVFGREFVARLQRRGRERVEDPAQPRPVLSMLAASPLLLGLWSVLDALVFGRADAPWRAFSATCSHAFSALPIEHIPRSCHYLCTVAARGHSWLVRPERLGARAGQPILVNRQLAVANAFEDLLIARLPRIARVCRRLYDRWGLPVSRWLRHPLACDLVYLAMKPAEWTFYLALLLFDTSDPERRIARMYPAARS